MGLEIHMQKHHGKARDERYAMVPLQVSIDDRKGGGGWKSSQPSKEEIKACGQGYSRKMVVDLDVCNGIIEHARGD